MLNLLDRAGLSVCPTSISAITPTAARRCNTRRGSDRTRASISTESGEADYLFSILAMMKMTIAPIRASAEEEVD